MRCSNRDAFHLDDDNIQRILHARMMVIIRIHDETLVVTKCFEVLLIQMVGIIQYIANNQEITANKTSFISHNNNHNRICLLQGLHRLFVIIVVNQTIKLANVPFIKVVHSQACAFLLIVIQKTNRATLHFFTYTTILW